MESNVCMVLNKKTDVVISGLDDGMVVESGGKILVAKKGADIEGILKKLEE